MNGEQERREGEGKECIFCAIVQKKIPAMVIGETQNFLAFLDIQPRSTGHTVIVPKRHVLSYDRLSPQERAELAEFQVRITSTFRDKLGATGYTAVSPNGPSSGQLTGHYALHLLPTFDEKSVELAILQQLPPRSVARFVNKKILEAFGTG